MNRDNAKPAALKRVRPFYDNAVTAHKIARFKIAYVAGKYSVTRAVNDKLLTVQAKRSALADNILVTVAMLGHVLDHLAVQ